jgi:hypothetical protein
VEDGIDRMPGEESGNEVAVRIRADLQSGAVGHRRSVARREVVEHDDVVARLEQPRDRD